MKIGIDLDEVLVDFLPALIRYHNATYSTSLSRDDFFTYHYWDVWGGTVEEAIKKVCDFHQTPYFKELEPISGTQEAIGRLKEGNELFIITSRQESIADATKDWVAKYFPGAFSDVFLTNQYSLNGNKKTKKEYCELLGVEVLIEDQLKYALECLSRERRVFLLDCPWNKAKELPEGIKRVYSWQEIIETI